MTYEYGCKQKGVMEVYSKKVLSYQESVDGAIASPLLQEKEIDF